jgi:hypothetical protein
LLYLLYTADLPTSPESTTANFGDDTAVVAMDSDPAVASQKLQTDLLAIQNWFKKWWSLTLREEHRLRVFENRVLRRIFGPKRDEVTGEWRKLHNEELRDLYSSPSIIRIIKTGRMRWAGHVAQMGEKWNAYRLLVGKRPLGRLRRR